jgi:hypothetical protein
MAMALQLVLRSRQKFPGGGVWEKAPPPPPISPKPSSVHFGAAGSGSPSFSLSVALPSKPAVAGAGVAGCWSELQITAALLNIQARLI